jgi:hypothetical protein
MGFKRSCVHKISGRTDGLTDGQVQRYMLPHCGGITSWEIWISYVPQLSSLRNPYIGKFVSTKNHTKENKSLFGKHKCLGLRFLLVTNFPKFFLHSLIGEKVAKNMSKNLYYLTVMRFWYYTRYKTSCHCHFMTLKNISLTIES